MESGGRKYFTEIALSVMTKGSMVFRPSVMAHLDKANSEAREVLDAASIYFVCTKPRIRINASSLERHGDALHFELELETESGRKTGQTVVPNFFLAVPGVEAVRIHPRLSFYIELLDAQGKNAGNMPVEFVVNPLVFPGENLTHYEVLYVGQSQVGKASGNIVSRLSNHSTLQAILGDILANAPHREVFLMCFELEEPRYMLVADPHAKVSTTDEEDTRHLVEAFDNAPTPAQVTSIAEACYIRYFQPIYNQRLKNSFPSTNLKLLQTSYELDFNAIIAEVNTEDLAGVIFSQHAAPSFHHVMTFDLHSPEDRRSFFVLTNDHDGTTLHLDPTNPS